MIDPVRLGAVKPALAQGPDTTTPVRVSLPVARILPSAKEDTKGSVAVAMLGDVAATLRQGGPPVDLGKVALVKAAIADGRYPIDATAIARAIIGFAAKG